MTYTEIVKYAGEISPAVLEAFNVVKPNGYMTEDPNSVEATVNEAYQILTIVYPGLVGTHNFNKAAVLYGYYGVYRVSPDECKALGWKVSSIIPDEVKKMLKGA